MKIKLLPIAIPSKNRATCGSTFELLCGTPGIRIYIFVEPDEVKSYTELYSPRTKNVCIVDIQKKNQGISYVRNFILDFFSGQPIIMMDDDIKMFYRRENGKLRPTDAIVRGEMVAAIYHMLEKGYGQATVSYQASNWLCTEPYKLDTRQWCVLGIRNVGAFRFDASVDTFEDYDYTAQLLFAGYTNISLYTYAFSCSEMGKTGGGLQCFDRKKLSEVALQNIMGKWGPFMKVKKNPSTDILEPQFFWKRLKRGLQ